MNSVGATENSCPVPTKFNFNNRSDLACLKTCWPEDCLKRDPFVRSLLNKHWTVSIPGSNNQGSHVGL